MQIKAFSQKTSLLMIAVFGLLIGVFVYATIDKTVYTTEQLIVIPDTVTSNSWSSVENALVNDVIEESLYQDFSQQNSAYIDAVSIVTVPEIEVVEPEDSGSENPGSEGEQTEAPDTESSDGSSDDTTETTPDEVLSGEEEVLEESTAEPEPEVVDEPEPIEETESEPETSEEVSDVKLFPFAQEVITTDVNEVPVEQPTESEVVTEEAEEESEVVPESTPEVVEESEPETVGDDEGSVEPESEEGSGSETGEEEVTTEESGESSETGEENITEEEVLEEEEIIPNIEDDCIGDENCKLYSTVFSGFSMPEFESGVFLSAAQLRLSLGARTKSQDADTLQRFVVEYTYEEGAPWRTATIIDIEDEIANSINGGYFLVSLERPHAQSQLSNLQVRVSYQGDISQLERAYVESIWLEVTSASFYEETDPEYLSGAIDYDRMLEAPKFHELNNPDLDPSMAELPSFTLSYSPQQGFLRRTFNEIFSENQYQVDSVKITDGAGTVVTVPVDVIYHDDMTWTVQFLQQPQKLVPGKYQMELIINENDTLYTDTFEFYWGVLAVNTTKSMYFANEDVTLNLAALTEKGDTICDARLELKIIDPTNAIFEIPVEQSGSCGKNNVTDVPDYLAYFKDARELGEYTIQLKHLNREGEVVHSIRDHFEVREFIPYDIERTAPTRIYPPAPYDVSLKIKANRTFEGDITERIPRGFVLTENPDGAEVVTMPEYTELVWKNIVLEEGDRLDLSYQFDAPDISPYMFLLGPLNMDGFTELRQWQIASDALTSIGSFSGTRTIAGTNLNQTASPMQWSTSSVDTFYYTHSTTTDSHEVTLRQTGDYFLAISLPQQRTDGNARGTRIGVEVRVNGVTIPEGLGRSGYISNQGGHAESSTNAHFLLTNISANDVLEVYAEGLTTINVADIVNVTGKASMYLEYIGVGTGVFSATTTQTTNSTNLNQTTEYPLSWIETRQDSGFVHSDAINPEQIILSNPGKYLVQVSVPLTSSSNNNNIIGRVRLDGALVDGGQFKQGYVQSVGTESDADSSMHWSGVVVSTTTNQVLTFGAIREANTGTVTVPSGFVGTVVVRELPSTEVISLRGTAVVGGTNWNPAAAAAVQWVNRDAYDSSIFTHSTSSNSHQITIGADGDYLVSYNDALQGSVARANSRVTILKNGTGITGAQTKSHYIRNQNNHTESSSALVMLIEDLLIGDVITVTVQQEAAAGTLDDSTSGQLLMWKKAEIDFRPDAPVTYGRPFDNIRFASTTPFFDFSATDPDGTSNIEYEFSISTSTGFTASTTFNSSVDSEFFNTSSSTDLSPFVENNIIRFQLTGGDALTDLTTYYWRSRARDITGSGEFGDWSTTQSLTVDLAAEAPSWFQSYSGQFEGNSLVGTISSGEDRVRVDASVSPEVLIAYGEGTNTSPRYRLWNGSSWGVEGSAQAVSGTINWVRTAASVSRDEYALITLDSASDSFVQVYSASSSSWGNRVLMSPVVVGPAYRGIAVGYESVSGDLMSVSCTNSPNPVYRIWNGSSWSATSTIPVSSLNNCNFLELASDPASDEMILVVRDTGTQYEALVWNGTAWVESRVIGSSAKVAREGMTVAYEASGDQAIVAVSNGTNNGFIYTTWNGVEFSTNAAHALGNDFEFGLLTSDFGADEIALCYIDEDNDIGVVRWNGGVWATAVEIDTGGNADTGRPIDCRFETTAGRSDYLMAAYSDTTNVRYRTATSSVYSTEATIGTKQDSYWVQTARAGDGLILSASLDDGSDVLNVSSWNGTSWSAETALETSPSSVIAAPYEMYDMSAKRFQFAEGVVTTPPINFTDVPAQPTWGDINFSTTEPFGTDVQVRVKYSNVGTCDAYIPDIALAGNSTGFDVTDSPIDLVAVSTTTYDQICLEATLTTLGDDSATLEEWTLAWVRQPKLIQNRYRFYVNGSFLTPTDPWPVGVDDTAENTPIDSSIAINIDEKIRLRMSLQGENVELPAFSEAFKLQYAEGFTCSNSLTWQDVGDTASTTALWRGYENSIVGDDWYSASWGRRIKVTIDSGLVTADQTNFPIYLNLDDFPDAFFSNVQSDGDDIRITEDDGVTEVPYELVTIDTSAKTGELHFKANVSSTTDSEFFVYYGNGSASGYSVSSTYGRNNVWTNGFLAVFHLDQSPTASAPQFIDSTGNNTGTAVNLEVGDRLAGVVGRAIDHDGVDEHITTNMNQNMLSSTWSIWLNTDGAQGAYDGVLMSRGTLTNGINIDSAGTRLGYHWRDAVNTYSWVGGPLYPTNQWFMASLVVQPTTATMFAHSGSGVASGTNAVTHATATIDAFTIGRDPFGAARSFNGLVDEITLSNVARSSTWLSTTYNNKSNPTGFYGVSGEELISDGRLLPSTVLSESDESETYEEENPTRDNQNPLPVGDDAEWDFVLENNGATPDTNYCFRMVYEDGALLNSYQNYPRLITNAPPQTSVLVAPFDNERLASTTPWFEFYADDELEDEVAYEIEVSTDYAFGSTVINSNSIASFALFTNLIQPAQKSQFTSGDLIQFISTTPLSNGNTYWWRVRSQDPDGSGAYSEWSVPESFTVNTSNTITTWFQTTGEQFATNNLLDGIANSGDTGIDSGFTVATTTSTVIDYDDRDTGNAWGSFSFTNNVSSGSIEYFVEYRVSGENFALVPDVDLPGNSSGFNSSPISLVSLNTVTYNELRLVAVLSGNATLPRLQDWTVTWSETIEIPTHVNPFDNAKVSTTTPALTFFTSDPENDDLQYEVQLSSSFDFTSSSTFTSGVSSGFSNTENGGDTSPFANEDVVQYLVQSALTNGNTYWWRVRARDPLGTNNWSDYSTQASFTVDTTITTSIWHQTTGEQFETNELFDIETTAGTAQITSVITEVVAVYGEGTGQSPQYRLWNGTSWSTPSSALTVGAQIRWLELKAAPTRPEYALGTLGTDLDVNFQIYNSETDAWGDLVELQTTSVASDKRTFNLAYESQSGDLLAIACNGTDAVYSIWNGSSWSATSSIALTNANNCEFIQVASDPTSDEVIVVFRHAITSVNDYEAFVWNGSSFGNAAQFGELAQAAHEGMAVAYEESGGQAIVAVSNGANTTLLYNIWNGSAWSGTTTHALGDHIEWASLKTDVGTDRLALCYIDNDADVGVLIWSGSAWNTVTELDIDGNDVRGRAIDCEWQVGTNDGDLLVVYSDTVGTRYQTFDTVFSGELSIALINDTWEAGMVRAGDGLIHLSAYDDALTPDRIDHSRWDGAAWSTRERFSDNASLDNTLPYVGGVSMAPQTYPNFISGSIRSTAIDFEDGTGPRWDTVSWNDTTPGASEILYRVYYESAPGVFSLIPDVDLPGNSTGFSSSPVDISNVNRVTYSILQLDAQFTCDSGNCPTLQDWSLAWSEGITLSGIAREFDGTSTTTSGTVGVAVNGVLQASKTGTILANGTWSISNVTAFPDDTVTVFVNGAADNSESTAIATYDGVGNITGMELIKRHVTFGSDSAATTTIANFAGYDNSDDEDIFFTVGALNAFTLCAEAACADGKLKIKSGTTFVPGATITTHDLLNIGSFRPATNTVRVSGSWDNQGTFVPDTSTVLFSATSTAESINTSTSTLTFYNLTLGEGSSTATWTVAKPITISNNLAVTFGTLARGTSTIAIAGNLQVGATGYFSGLATTTFNGSGSHTWSDAKSATTSSNVGYVVIDGTSKTIALAGNVGAESVTIGADDTLNASGSGFNINVRRSWVNNNSFIPQTGTVTFVGTTTGSINRGASSFNNLAFTGVGGNWSFSTSTLVLTGNLSIATGTVTLPTGTTTIGGSFTNTDGTFLHNNGEVRMTSTTGGRTIAQSGTAFLNAFYDLVFAGTGSWSYSDSAATTTRNFRIQSGTVTLPSGSLTVGGDYSVTGSGAFAHNNGEVILLVSDADEVRANGSSFNNLRVKGAAGSWYSTSWSGRVPVTIEADLVDENLTDFPVYVNLDDMPDAFFSALQTDGDDIRVTTGDGFTEVPFELVTIDTVAKTGEVHFKGTLADSTDTTFYVYYGNPSAGAYATTATYGRNNVWSNGFAAVFHMDESPTASAPQYVDSTGSSTGTSINMEVGDRLAGQVGRAADIDGADEAVSTTFNRTISTSTWSLWMRADGNQTAYDGIVFSRSGQTTGLNIDNTANRLGYHWNDAAATYNWNGGPVYPRDSWFMASLVVVPTQATAYVHATSGVTSGVNVTTHANSLVNNIHIGQDSSGGRFFNGILDEIRIANVARTSGWLSTSYNNMASTTQFYVTGAGEGQYTRTFADTNATVLGNVVLDGGGDSIFNTGILSVGGSFTNNAQFNSNNGTVRFNSTAGAETIAAGSSTFATLEFNSATGDFTITQSATATVAINLTNASQFTLSSGRTLAAQGTFTNALTGGNTTWTGSTLRLLSGLTVNMNAKTHGGDVYGTLEAASSTLAKMWNSSATSYVTSGVTGAIYSQDHAAVDGDLYIYGNYIRTTGTEYWSYATDFDGTALIASTSRQVDVRIATSSQIGFTSASLNLVGAASASTTIDAQSGAFGLSATNTTMTAQYFTASGTDAFGFRLVSSSTISMLQDGAFAVRAGRSALTIDSTTIDANPAAQFERMRFATTTAGAGTNVTVLGTPSSYIWFRNGAGNLYGEAYDNDPGGNPGNVRFDDSNYSVTVSGTVYSDDGVTPMGAPVCNNASPVVTIAINGVPSFSGPCSSVNGTYSINGVTYSGDADVAVFLDTNTSGTTTTGIRSETTGFGTTTAGGVFTVNKPASVQNGDYLVAITGKDDSVAITGPAGWTSHVLGTVVGNARHTGIWYKLVTDATLEPASYTFTGDATEVYSYWIGSLTGVSPTNPEDVSFAGRWTAVQNDTTPDAASVTTATTNSFVLSAWYVDTDNAVTMPGAPWSTRAANIVSNEANNLSVSSRIMATAAATGVSTITGVGATADTSMAQFAFRRATATTSSVRAVTVTKTPSGNITGLNLYQNRVIVRHEDSAPTTIADMVLYDADNDSDMLYTAATGTPNTLLLPANTELYVFTNKTFAPGGNVTLGGSGNANGYEGTLQIASGATFTASGTETHRLAGRLVMATTSTLTSASSTFIFNATTTGKSITSPNLVTFNQLQFAGTGGGWNITAPISVVADMNIASGTVTGTNNITIQNGSLYGNGVLSLGSGTTTINRTNTLGGTSAWTFANLVLGNGSVVGTTSPVSSATTTVSGTLTIANAHFLDAGNSVFDLSGTGNVLVRTGTFLEDTSTIRFSGSASNVPSINYYNLVLNAGAGSATYTGTGSGILVYNDLVIGGTATSSFTANTNDPVVEVRGDVFILGNGTLQASNSANLTILGDYTNSGTFVGNGGTVRFTGSTTSVINAGSSSFSNVTVDGTGTFSLNSHATATNAFTLTNHSAFNVNNGRTLSVGGQFTNTLGGATTNWGTSTLSLTGSGTYSINASTTSDTYNNLAVAAGTQIRMWNSSAASYAVNATGSLYSQDHAGVNGDAYIWGQLVRTTGNDYWSYATDFDGTNLTGSERQAEIYFASGASARWSGGSLSAIGASSATTTIQNQGSGTYGINFATGATVLFDTVQVRDINSSGVVFSGAPTVTDFSRTDHLVSINSGTAITVGGTAINANEAKNFTNNKFEAGGGVTGAVNVTATGTTISSWRFTNHTGNIAGEGFDSDPAGDPGYVVWDDSAALITVSGNVYSDEGVTVSTVCNGSTNNIRLVVAGLTTYNTSCNATTGAYSISGVAFSPLDTLTLFINGETPKATTVSVSPISSISNMHLYHNRVLVRHENTDPITIANMAVWDSSNDGDINFTATTTGTDTLSLPADTKLLIWTGKTFEPNGNVTLAGAGAGAAHDGTLEAQTNARFRAKTTESHSVGGSVIFGTGAEFVAASSTLTLTTTGASRTFDVNNASLHNLTVSGVGSYVVTDSTLTLGGSYTQSNGAVTFPTGTTTIGASFNVTSGSFTNSGSPFVFTSTAGGNTVRFNNSLVSSLQFTRNGSFTMSDTNATSTGSVLITGSTVSLPSGNFAIGGSFEKRSGTVTHNTSDIIMTATSSAILTASSSDLYGIRFNGPATFTITDPNITFLDSFTIASGSVVMATGTTAVGGSFDATGGTFTSASGTVLLNSSSAGRTVNPGASAFYNLQFGAPSGGYTLFSATTTNNFTIASANILTVNSGAVITVGGVFTNSVGGVATTWTNTTLRLISQTGYSINTRLNSGDVYGTLSIGANTDIRSWYSSAATTTVAQSGSLYSQDNANANGALYIYGDLAIATTTEYWNFSNDFDGTTLTGGNQRRVTVSFAPNATTTVLSGSLQIIGSSSSSTVIQNQGTGTYNFAVTGGTLEANYYEFGDMDIFGLQLSGLSTVEDLSNGYFDIAVTTGSAITLSSTTLNANPSKTFNSVGFNATGPLTGFNVNLVGETANAWRFASNYGNIGGEGFDIDGIDACGSVRFDNSSCLLTEQTHVRWRHDDGGEGAPSSEWFESSFDYRTRVRVLNNDAQAYTTTAVKVTIPYDSSMQADFDDIRFTSDNGQTQIPFWIEKYTASTDAQIWVRIPTLPASDYATVFMYYGSSTAASISSGTSTMTAFDDYEDASISEYSGDTSLFTTVTSPVYGGARSLAPSITSGKTTDGIFRFDDPVAQGQIIRYTQYVNTAGSGDEPCTLFGVQSPGTTNANYGVCLEQLGVDRISLARDVDNNDISGVVLSTTTVTYSTGWYEVEIDWQTNNTIKASLFNSAGTLVASTTATDANYTSGGFGYAFWFQNGAWDSFSSRPRVTTKPTVFLGAKQTDGGASWASAVDGATSAITGDIRRLRIAVENSGLDVTGQQYRLEFAAKGAAPTCESVSSGSYATVPNQSSCGSSPVCMQTSSFVGDGDPTTDLLLGTEGTFSAGSVVESPSTQTGSTDLDQDHYTEIEYVLTPTVNASDAYCFRVTNGGTPLDFYAKIAELGLQFDPTFGAITLNGGGDISLTPGTTTPVTVTGTITDFNGASDITHATATIYRSGAGPSCTADNNNCYIATTENDQCTLTSCAGNSCTLSCEVDIFFHADATDDDPYLGENWLAYAEAEDFGGGYDFASAIGVELNTLRALTVDSIINYGALSNNSDTGSFNPTTTITNLGNTPINVDVEGTDLSDGQSSSISASQQKVATTTFNYSACVGCQQLSSSSAVTLGINLSKPSVQNPPVETDVYWGIAVPFTASNAAHTGTNIFTAIGVD